MLASNGRLHDAVLLPYAARHPQYFGLGSDAAQIGAQVQALSPQVQDVLYGELEKLFSSRSAADDYLFTVNGARGLDAVLRQQPRPSPGARSRSWITASASPSPRL